MRIFSLIASLLVIAPLSAMEPLDADDAIGGQLRPGQDDGDDTIAWTKAFEPIASPQPSNDLVLLVITNDMPWSVDRDQPSKVSNRVPGEAFWCQALIEQSLQKLYLKGPTLNRPSNHQFVCAGLPLEIAAGQSSVTPAGAIIALCDQQYRLLSFTVGIPEPQDFAVMLRDARATRSLIDRATDDPQTVIDRLADRGRSRVSRLFRATLAELVSASSSDGDDENHFDPAVIRHRIKTVCQDVEQLYLHDTRLRFGLSSATDRDRLRVLEQHVETRRPWCELMIPFVAGIKLTDCWRPLVESLWGYPPTLESDPPSDLLRWAKLQLESNAVVLQLKPPMQLEHISWPPIPDRASNQRDLWRDVHSRALEHPFRQVDASEAAYLIRELDLRPINIYRPSLARYLFLRPNKRDPLVIRENDRPGRFAGILKRSKTELVKK